VDHYQQQSETEVFVGKIFKTLFFRNRKERTKSNTSTMTESGTKR
jgi:hypothetical protein